METIIVSACLLGEKCRYDGKDNYTDKVKFLKEHFNIVPICPETFGGMSTPRVPSERKKDLVINQEGKDVTKYFEKGTDDVINIVKYLHIKKAVLVENSPSCGINKIYNGKFNKTLIDGQGFTTEALIKLGVSCYTIDECEKLIDKTQKEVFEETEKIREEKEKIREERAQKNMEYSRLSNRTPFKKTYTNFEVVRSNRYEKNSNDRFSYRKPSERKNNENKGPSIIKNADGSYSSVKKPIQKEFNNNSFNPNGRRFSSSRNYNNESRSRHSSYKKDYKNDDEK